MLAAGVTPLRAQERELMDPTATSGIPTRGTATLGTGSLGNATLKRIAGYDPTLGSELERGVRTGTFCAYDPDPGRPWRWIVER